MYKSIVNLAPGIPSSLHGLLFVLCFVTFLVWLTLVLWRMNHSQVVAWKGPWLAAAGISALSITTVYLFEPVIDRARSYEPIVRINSQSGKGGVAFVLESYYGYKLPKAMHREFAKIIQDISERRGEIQPAEVFSAFEDNYIIRHGEVEFEGISITDTAFDHGERQTLIKLRFLLRGEEEEFAGLGNGPLDAAQQALEEALHVRMRILDYTEHALSAGSTADAVAYIQLLDQDSGRIAFGVGRSSNTMKASIRGLFSAVNRLFYAKEIKR